MQSLATHRYITPAWMAGFVAEMPQTPGRSGIPVATTAPAHKFLVYDPPRALDERCVMVSARAVIPSAMSA